jgi:hypothetical protein
LTDGEFDDWTKVPKFTVEEISTVFEGQKLSVPPVHASRDIGNYLCSARERDLEKGKQLIYDSLSLADNLEAEVCVFHL